MRKQWLGVCLVLCAATTAHAQQWQQGYSPYYGNPYYPSQQASTPRYYSPPPNYGYGNGYGNGAYYGGSNYNMPRASAYYTPPTATYYSPPATTYYSPPATSYRPSNPSLPASIPSRGPVIASPVSQAVQRPIEPETIVEVQPQASPMAKAVQIEEVTLPGAPSAEDRDRGNIAIFWDKVFDYFSSTGEVANRSHNDYLWASANYKASFLRPMRLAGPIVSSGSFNDAFPGSIGQPTTVVRVGGDPINFNMASGFDLTIGAYLDGASRFSVDVTGFAIFPNQRTMTISSDGLGNPVVARPVFATDENRQGSFAVAAPGLVTGSSRVNFSSQLSSAELNLRSHGVFGSAGRADALFGFRYARLAERMSVQDDYAGIQGTQTLFNGGLVDSAIRDDAFETTNSFIGGQLGGQLSWDHRWLNITGFAKIGLGGTVQKVDIAGSTTATTGATVQTAPGGILALPSNIGTYSRTVFSVLPEMGVNVGLNVTENVRLKLGYSALLWSSVVRPGSQYDTRVNSGLAPTAMNFGAVNGPFLPAFRFVDEHFWVQSVNVGVELHF